MTLVGPGLAFTDAYATAVFAMGLDGLRWLASEPETADYAAYAITDDDRVDLDRRDGTLPGPRVVTRDRGSALA